MACGCRMVLPTIAWGVIFAAFVFCQRIPVVGEGIAAPLPKVATVGDDGETIAVDEEEDEAVQAERGATSRSILSARCVHGMGPSSCSPFSFLI